MAKYVLYYHGGSKNHGCEAIVRSTQKILNSDQITLFSSAPEEDVFYGIDKILCLKEDRNRISELSSVKKFIAAVSHKIRNDDYRFCIYGHEDFFNSISKGDICFSIGGDNYCYKGQDILSYYNKGIHRRGAKTVLWGCSIEPEMIDEKIKQDLSEYDLIVTRETISFNCLKEINPNTILCCDPAFQLDCASADIPNGFEDKKVIGINLSPLVSEYGNQDLILSNYINLVNYIIDQTDYNIALIPHVVKNQNDDRTVLEELYNAIADKQRVFVIEDMNCMQLKTIISKCEMFIGARTHATIAAYSTCVPTLVVGYSVKARGIAKDLFGTEENYVLPVQALSDNQQLTGAFKWLESNKESIKNYLMEFIPEYKKTARKAVDAIKALEKQE